MGGGGGGGGGVAGHKWMRMKRLLFLIPPPLPYYLIYFELGFKRFSVKRGENYCSFKHQSVPKELKVK